MAKRLADAMETARPKKVTRAALADACKVTQQAVYDWLRTGKIARKHFPKIARATGRSIEYFFGDAAAREPSAIYSIDGLPEGLQRYLARKAEELRAYAAAVPTSVLELANPPEDEDQYRQWERKLEADMARIRFAASAKRDEDVRGQGRPARRRGPGSSRG